MATTSVSTTWLALGVASTQISVVHSCSRPHSFITPRLQPLHQTKPQNEEKTREMLRQQGDRETDKERETGNCTAGGRWQSPRLANGIRAAVCEVT